MLSDNYFIISMPRSGSSMLSNILIDNGLNSFAFPKSIKMSAHEHNSDGYFEDVKLTLLNDQIIRAKYGAEFSFLFPPPQWKPKKLKDCSGYEYDLNENTVVIPDDFRNRLRYYTNNDWDVWGLTRMLDGGKWHRTYSKHEVDNISNILIAIQEFKRIYSNSEGLLIKDPRMIFSMLEFDIVDPKIIFLRRQQEGVINSCRKHYGPYLFNTQECYDNFPYASNHFNLKINRMSYKILGERYANFEKKIKYNLKPSAYVDVCYEELLKEKSKSRMRLERFFRVKLNWKKVRNGKL